MKGYTVTVKPSGKSQVFPEGTLICDALLDMGIPLKTPCGGKGTCGHCRVSVTGNQPPRTPSEERILRGTPGVRLSCQVPLTGDVEIRVEERLRKKQRRVPHHGNDRPYGLAVDIGTTNVRISMVETGSGSSYHLDSFLNPQRRFGHDVISRISAASSGDVLKTMQALIRTSIFSSIADSLDALGISPERITCIAFSGNTTMLYLLLGKDVSPLGTYPYPVSAREFSSLTVRDLGETLLPETPLLILPVLSAFLGGDLIGGLALCHKNGIRKNAFFIDLGTNGELFLLDQSGLVHATSCAMGPALEGMNLSWGMTAEDGAIVHVTQGAGGLFFEIMGEIPPSGISGTGVIDLISILLEKGYIEESGVFASPADVNLPSPLSFGETDGIREIRIGNGIALTQVDVRTVQLAKGASLAASELLLKEARCSADDIEHVFIAGSFGENLNVEHFRRLGFIPEFKNASWEFLGNTSLLAAQTVCCDPRFLETATRLRDRTRELVLANHPEFQDTFIRALSFSRAPS